MFYDGLPKKNTLLIALLYLRFPLGFSFIRSLIRRSLPHCDNIDFILGFRFLYGNIHAKNVFFGDTFLADYAPVYVGDYTMFSFENMIITSTHDLADRLRVIAKPVHIGSNVWVTSRCTILGGVTIGDNSVIAAGSVVTRDIPANCLAGGNPAKVIRFFEEGERERIADQGWVKHFPRSAS